MSSFDHNGKEIVQVLFASGQPIENLSNAAKPLKEVKSPSFEGSCLPGSFVSKLPGIIYSRWMSRCTRRVANHTPKTIGTMAKPVTVSGDTGNHPKSFNDLAR